MPEIITNQEFPLIEYAPGASPREWGRRHGESYKKGIEELCAIRRGLLLLKRPQLEPHLESLAHKQWQATAKYDPQIGEELEGIREGSGVSLLDLVILNNYTDFRDISGDEGCSTVYVSTEKTSFAGQTWDMHRSANQYVCVIHVPASKIGPESYYFSLVGCVGMMGFNSESCFVEINNINTTDAVPGVFWPAYVRKALKLKSLPEMSNLLQKTPVTSGHSYLIGDLKSAESWEVTPTKKKRIGHSHGPGALFHTNHCLDSDIQSIEDQSSISKTTHERYRLLDEKVHSLQSVDGLVEVLKSHDGFPKSICSHFESGAQDPSFTCGGGAMDLSTKSMVFWRGCDKSPDLQSLIEVKF